MARDSTKDQPQNNYTFRDLGLYAVAKARHTVEMQGVDWATVYKQCALIHDGLVRALTDAYPNVRAAAAGTLGAVGDQRAISPLTEALADSSILVRMSSALAIVNLGGQNNMEALRELEGIATGVVLREMGEAELVQAGVYHGGLTVHSPSEGRLPIDQVERCKEGWRTRAAAGLLRSGSAFGKAVLATLTNDASPGVRAVALGKAKIAY
jgi:hypothetical protein